MYKQTGNPNTGRTPAIRSSTGQYFLQLEDRLGPFSMDMVASRMNARLLETGPSSLDSRCSFNLMEEPLPIHVPSICPHTMLPGQVQRGESYSIPDSPSVAQSDLVPSVAQESDRPLNPPPSHSGYHDQPRGPKPSNGNGRSPPTCHLACLRKSCHAEGIQTDLLASSQSHGKCRLSPHTPMPGDSGIAGVLSGVLIHFQPL